MDGEAEEADGSGVTVRPASAEERPAVAGILEAALLVTGDLGAAIDRGDVLVAAADGRVVGALVLERPPPGPAGGTVTGDDGGEPDEGLEPDDAAAHVAAVAVRPGRRGRGVGSALVAAAADREDRLTASFRPELRGFYEALGFAVADGRGGQLFGVHDGP